MYNNKAMQQSNLSLQLLPRQKSGTITKPMNCQRVGFYSNIFKITLKEKAMIIYQYSFDISPELPPDSDGLIEKIFKVIVPQLKKNIGLICSRGFMAWGRKEMKTVLTCKAEFTKNEIKHSYEVLVKPIKSLGVQQFMINAENLPSISQVLNISVKNSLRKEKMVQLYPGSYYSNDTMDIYKTEGKLNVWRGFDASVSVYNKALYLQVDPCSRVLKDQSFLETLESDRGKIKLDEMNMKYAGHSVLRKYGSPKLYRIEQIDFKQTPKSKFMNSREGKEVTYLEYYRKEYGVAIKNDSQPLVKVLADKRMKRNNDPNFKQYIYLVPELLCLTGLNDDQRQNFRIMKSLGEYTKLTACDRMKETSKMVEMLQGDQDLIFEIESTPKALTGFKMNAPHIYLGKNREANVQKGTIFLKEKVLDPYLFKEIIFCYSVNDKYPEGDRQDADYALDLLRKAGKTFGIEIKEPIWIEVSRSNYIQSWYKALSAEKQMKGKVDLIYFFVKPQEEKFYNELKRYVALQFNCPCQISKRKLLSAQQKGNMSVASKLVMQMNAKIGHPLWTIENSHPILNERRVAVGGIASSKGKQATTIAFTGSTNQELTHYFSECKQVRGKESICTALFQGIFTQWIQNWFMNNSKKLPEVLVIYREGLNEVQAKFQMEFEVNGLKETIEKVRIKTKQPNYDPTILYILVNKKPKSRIFEGTGRGKNINYSNPEPGSIIFEDLSQGYKEFHLASAVVREGTCTPVSFKVAYENRPEFPLEAVSELTYNQTYGYFNWTGSVRVPAPLQYANKLAKQYSGIGEELKTEEKNSQLKSTLFFL